MKFDFKKILAWLAAVLLVAGVSIFIYTRSVPQTYSLSIGAVSSHDIIATADVVDLEATKARAADEAARVEMIMVRSEPISRNSLNLLNEFFELVDAERTAVRDAARRDTPASETGPVFYQLTDQQLRAAVDRLSGTVETKLSLELEDRVYRELLSVEKSIYDSMKSKALSFAEIIMAEKHDTPSLQEGINQQMVALTESVQYYKESYAVLRPVLSACLKPNAVYDEEATNKAKEAAYTQVTQNPILIPKGTRIVSIGDTITANTYEQLKSLNLLDTGKFNYVFFAGIFLLVFFCLGGMLLYLITFEKKQLTRISDRVTVTFLILAPLLLAGWLLRISPLAGPVAVTTIVLTIYFQMRCAVFISVLLNLLIMPMADNDPLFLVTATATVLVAALLAERFASRNRYAVLILGTTLCSGAVAFAYNVILKSGWMKTGTDAGIAALAGGLSAIIAIGINPIVEVFLSSVSPMKLVELAQPSHPLLRKLFLEAPGTYQHCIMVSNLAETAADAVGANSLLVRVGAYYHDIGKINNPYMFTENQADRNPHDNLPPGKSVEIIIAHVQQGLNVARKYHLPLPVQRIIMEHHGNTLQAYFLDKAKRQAEAEGLPPPDEADYRYPWPVPTCKESAIVMMADSCEAAMKSVGETDINGAEKLIRRIIKGKIDQDQLVSSGLSFQDVETVIQSFLQVYAGQFHKRVRYPGDQPDKKPAVV
jgi:putative nucleotidyltransferase with HDIG domain